MITADHARRCDDIATPTPSVMEMLNSALHEHTPLLAREIAREIVDRHRGSGRWRPALRHALASVDTLAGRFARAISARPEARFFRPRPVADLRAWRGDRDAGTFKGQLHVQDGHPFAVHPADDNGYRTLAVDIDAKTCDPASVCANVETLLYRAGVASVTCISGPEGSRHIFTTWREPVPHAAMWRVMRALKEAFPAIDTACMRNATEGCIRPPFARHYTWGRSRPVGDDVREALRILVGGNSPEVLRSLAACLGVPLLSRCMEGLLFRGDTGGRYATRSEVIQAIATAHANAGSTEAHLLADLLDENNAGGDGARDRKNPRRYIGRSWRKAKEWVAAHPAPQGRAKNTIALASIRAVIWTTPWRGQAGQTDWAVLLAHAAIAEKAGNVVYHASSRDVALGAGVALRTVVASHRRLRRQGWLDQRGPRAALGMATRWLIRVPDARSLPHTISPCENVCSKSRFVFPGLDLWRRHLGLGKGAARTYDALGDGCDTVAHLMAALGMTGRSVRKYLALLASYGLAVNSGALWNRGPADPVEVGRSMGSAGAAGRDRRRYEDQRRDFLEKCGGPRLKLHEKLNRKTGEVVTDSVAGRMHAEAGSAEL